MLLAGSRRHGYVKKDHSAVSSIAFTAMCAKLLYVVKIPK